MIEGNMYELISCTQRNLEDLACWTRMVVQDGMICRNLGYPIGRDMPNEKLLE